MNIMIIITRAECKLDFEWLKFMWDILSKWWFMLSNHTWITSSKLKRQWNDLFPCSYLVVLFSDAYGIFFWVFYNKNPLPSNFTTIFHHFPFYSLPNHFVVIYFRAWFFPFEKAIRFRNNLPLECISSKPTVSFPYYWVFENHYLWTQ